MAARRKRFKMLAVKNEARLSVTINGERHEFQEGLTILEALRSVGEGVPTLCSDARLEPSGNCRICLVQLSGRVHPVTACNTRLSDGMRIETRTPELELARRAILSMQAPSYPKEAVLRSPDKQFHKLLRRYKLLDQLGADTERNTLNRPDDSHTYIHVDMAQCVDCYRCVRICAEVQGQFVWQVWNRGSATQIRPDSGTTLRDSSCVSCGACVDACPSGALEDKSILRYGTPESWTRTTCPYCGTGCEMSVGVKDGRIVSVKPIQDAPVNRGHLCVKGRYAFDFVHAEDRVTEPMVRSSRGKWKTVSWEEAVEFVAKGLRRTVERYGADSIGVLGSARATNEENYLAQKFARVGVGTNNVDCCARVCHTPTAAAMKLMLGTGAATNSFDDIERARTILICGANPTENHPVIGARIKQAAVKGANLIVIDPRRIELARYAQVHLAPRPGTNIPLLNALACAIIDEGLADERFLEERVADVEEFRRFIGEYAPERVAEICGVDAGLIRKAARLYAAQTPSMSFHGLGLTEHTQGTEGVMCLVNLALLTGNLGKPGAGVNPLRGQNNVQGSAHMGCDPGTLTGSVAVEDGRALFERVWQSSLPATKGLNLLQMMDAAVEGKLKALWAIGYDIFLTDADANTTERALDSLELVIVQDMFLNETARKFATVFFPAASSFEKDGTFMNAERRIQRVRPAIAPLGNSKPDWEIIELVARALGLGRFFDFHSPEEIWNEVRAVWKGGAGATYERLERGGLQWPCPSENHTGTQILHTDSFSTEKRAALRRIQYRPTAETTDEEFPFLLMTGRTLYQFNAGTMTLRTPNAALRPTDYLDICPEDAARLGLYDGERVRLLSRYGEASLRLRTDSSIKAGELFATFHTAEVFLNRVTSPLRDRYVKSPEYKVTAVRIEKN